MVIIVTNAPTERDSELGPHPECESYIRIIGANELGTSKSSIFFFGVSLK